MMSSAPERAPRGLNFSGSDFQARALPLAEVDIAFFFASTHSVGDDRSNRRARIALQVSSSTTRNVKVRAHGQRKLLAISPIQFVEITLGHVISPHRRC